MIQTKYCKHCGKTKPISEFYVSRRGYSDGHMSKCKECSKAYSKKYQAENYEKVMRRHRQYYKENIEKIKAYDKKRYWENREAILERGRRYKEAHAEERKAYAKKRRAENLEELRRRDRELYHKNIEVKRARAREFYRKNKRKINARKNEMQKKKYANDTMFRLKKQARLMIYRSFDRKGQIKPERSEKILGCSLEFFAGYLKQTWQDKYGEEYTGQPCHIDHIIPIHIAKTPEEIKLLCHYTNLRLLTPEDNLAKNGKLIFD